MEKQTLEEVKKFKGKKKTNAKTVKKELDKEFDPSFLISEFIRKDKKDALEFRRRYDPIISELDTFARGEQWLTTNATAVHNKKWHGKPVTNYIHVVKNRKTSDMTFSDIAIKLLPLSSKHMDKVEVLNKVLNNVWKRMDAHYHINETVKDSRLFPYGVTKIEHNANKVIGEVGNLTSGEISIKNIEPNKFYWDPKAISIEQASYVFEMTYVTKSFLLSQKGFDQKLVAEIIEAQETADKAGDQDSGDIYDDTREYHVGQERNNFIFVELYIKYPINDSTNRIMKAFIVNDNVLWKDENIGLDDFPYAVLVEYKQTHEFAGKSSVMLVMDNQKFINQIDAVVHNLATQYQNPLKVISSDSGLDPETVAEFGDSPGAVFEVDGDIDKAIRSVKPNAIDKALLDITREKKQDIMLIANINRVQSGGSLGSAGASAGGAAAVLDESNSQDSDPKLQFQMYLKRVVLILLQYLKGHTEEIEYRIDNPADAETEYDFTTITPKDFKEIGHDIQITVPLSQSEMRQKKNELFQLLSLQTQTGTEYVSPKRVLELLDFPDKVEMINNLHQKERDEKETQQREMMVARITGELLAQSLAEAPKGVSIAELSQQAAMQAVKIVDEQFKKQTSGGTGGGGVGVAAPQNNQG